MDSLPNELLAQIATHLDTPPPSVTKFSYEPSLDLTYAEQTPLKSLSQVSWRLRRVTVPILFQHFRLALDPSPQWVPVDARILDSMQSQLTTLSDHELQIYQRMKSRLKSSPLFAYDKAFDDLLIHMCRVQEGDNFLKGLPHMLWFPHMGKTTLAEFTTFVSDYRLKQHVKSIVVFTDKAYKMQHIPVIDAHLRKTSNEIWSPIFDHLDPSRVVVAAPPPTMAGLLDIEILSSDEWAFGMHMHYLEFAQDETICIERSNSARRVWYPALIHRRHWTHLGHNEGSSVAAYSTYEYHLKQPPMIIHQLIARFVRDTDSCSNIRSVSFVGVFPFSSHVAAVLRALKRLRTVMQYEFQISPGPENDLLDSPERLGKAQLSDLWLEFHGSYRMITNFLKLLPGGGRFVSKDCAKPRLKEEVEDFMDVMQISGFGWRRVGELAWVRDQTLDKAPVVEM